MLCQLQVVDRETGEGQAFLFTPDEMLFFLHEGRALASVTEVAGAAVDTHFDRYRTIVASRAAAAAGVKEQGHG